MNKVDFDGKTDTGSGSPVLPGERSMAIARYTLAIDRRKTQQNSDPGADFINCVAFDRAGEFAEKYFRQGTPGSDQWTSADRELYKQRLARRSIRQMLSLRVRSLRIA